MVHLTTKNGSNKNGGGSCGLRMAASPVKHIAIETWLSALGLEEYQQNFAHFHGVEAMLDLSEAGLRDLGVRNSAHRARMRSSLVMLKEKLTRHVRGHTPRGSPAHSANSSPYNSPYNSPPSLVNHPDYALTNSPAAYQSVNPITGQLQALYTPGQLQGSYTPHSLDFQDINRHAWFHGSIPRPKAEILVIRDGDFLVRDSVSQPGNYVLTCYWQGAPLHFVVNKVTVADSSGASRTKYQFEESAMDSVPELIELYVSTKRPISELSGAMLSHAIVRNAPADYSSIYSRDIRDGTPPLYASKPSPLAGAGSSTSSPSYSPKQSPVAVRKLLGLYGSPKVSPNNSPVLGRKHQKAKRTSSQPLMSSPDDRQMAAPPAEQFMSLPPTPAFTVTPMTNGKADNIRCDQSQVSMHTSKLPPQRAGSDPTLPQDGTAATDIPAVKLTNSGSDSDLSKPPPPKPSRIPSTRIKGKPKPLVQIRNLDLYDDDGRDYSDYDQVKSWSSAVSEWRDDEMNKNLKISSGIRKTDSQTEILSALMNRNSSSTTCSNQPEMEDNDYDNNFGSGYDADELEDYDVPRSDIYEIHLNKTPERDIGADSSYIHPAYGEYAEIPDDVDVVPSKLVNTSLHLPDPHPLSFFDGSDYESQILPPNNKPLDGSGLTTAKMLILDGEPRLLAQYITKYDLTLLKVIGDNDLGVRVRSGLEIITLPQGKQMREDLLERSECLKLFVAVTVLCCSRYPERARMLHTWIQVAVELRGALGNLYSFSSVMAGLNLLQVRRLKNTWISLKQNHTHSSFLFESKLNNFMTSLDEAGSSLPLQNVTIPHLIPLITLMDREMGNPDIFPWEEDGRDFGLDILLAHLDTARIITENYGIYRVTAENVLKDFRANKDMSDIFRTEMHLRLLWGSRGAGVIPQDRYSKFGQVLTVLSERAEPSQVPATESEL